MPMEQSSPWICADLEQWSSLVREYQPVMLKKNAVLYQQEDPPRFVYIVKSGRICVTSYQIDGGEKQLFIAEKGTLFGEDSCLMGLPYFATAVAIVDTAVYAIPFGRLQEAMHQDSKVSDQVMQMLCRKNLVLLQQVRELSSADAFQRVAQVLVNLCRQYGEEKGGCVRIAIRFTHQDVANLINASRVTVSNVFNALSGEGILEKREGHFYVRKLELLEQLARGEQC